MRENLWYWGGILAGFRVAAPKGEGRYTETRKDADGEDLHSCLVDVIMAVTLWLSVLALREAGDIESKLKG